MRLACLLFNKNKLKANGMERKQLKNCWSGIDVRQRSLRLITHKDKSIPAEPPIKSTSFSLFIP